MALIDWRHATSLREAVGEEAWGQATATFASGARQIVAQIQAAATEKAANLPRLAHNLKGTAANIGALRLSRFAALLENSGDSDDRVELLAHLETALEDTLAMLRDHPQPPPQKG
jgi:HPt (histidine-containing phosphotransfer) domain-containing protein